MVIGITPNALKATQKSVVCVRQTASFNSAMATKPKLLLMDEPVGGLTAREVDRVMDAVRAIKAAGVTIILIEHVMRFLVRLSDRIMIMHHGEKIFEGLPTKLLDDRTVVDVYLGQGASARLRSFMENTHG